MEEEVEVEEVEGGRWKVSGVEGTSEAINKALARR